MDATGESEIAEVLFLKHTFDESEADVTLQVFLLETAANSDSVRISCTETHLRIDFLNNSQSNEGNRTWSRWQIALRGRIVPDQCSFRILPNRARTGVLRWSAKLEVQIRKAEGVKWVNLESSTAGSDSQVNVSGDNNWRVLTSEPVAPSGAARNVVSSPKRADGAARSNASGKTVSKKPFCLVSPNNAQNTTFAGYTGIENQKNCCFMNAVLQVLANTRVIRDFSTRFEQEADGESWLKKARVETAVEADKSSRSAEAKRSVDRERKSAERGELVRALCTIVNDLWTGAHPYVAPTQFRSLFCARYAQFAGNLQQDAHEFLTFLLDGIRDELTHNSQEPAGFMKAFLGELRSEICCMECEHVSTRRDAFFCLSVPIPKPASHVRVHFMSYLPSVRPRPLDIELPASADDRAPCTLNVLRHVASRMRCRVPDLRMYEVHQGRFHRLFTPHSTLDEIAPGDQLVVQQVVGPPTHDGQYVELLVTQRVLLPNAQFAVCCNCHAQAVSLKRCKLCYRVAYCSRDCQVKHYPEHASWCRYVPALVGCPFILSVPRARASFDYVCERMQQYALWSVDVTYRTPPPLLHALTTPAALQSATSSSSDSIDVDIPSAACNTIPELVSPPIEDAHCVMDCAVCTNADGSHPQLALMLADACGQPFRPPKADERAAKWEPDACAVNRRKFMFAVKEANEHGLETGRTLAPSAAGSSEPLELSGWKYVYMDWLNMDRNRPYVLVESKPALGTDTPIDAPSGSGSGTDSACAAVSCNASIYDCLSSFTECEMLHAAEAWRCPRCDNLQAASKQLTISRPPELLVVHLKRFKPNREKLDAHVDFPILALDIGKFVVRDGEALLIQDDEDGKPPTQSEHLYDLYATVNHYGVTTGGHYTAFARLVDAHDSTRSEFGWREFDDVNVKVLQDANVVRSRHAYLLFYKRRSSTLQPLLT